MLTDYVGYTSIAMREDAKALLPKFCLDEKE